MSIYPPEIAEAVRSPKYTGRAVGENAVGMAASFSCGSLVRISMRVESEDKVIAEARFQTNGCGYLIAAAEAVLERLTGRGLREINGQEMFDPDKGVITGRSEPPMNRAQCRELVIEAVRSALADQRSRVIEEFQGEKALICTCFGIEEETVRRAIEENGFIDVSEVTQLCKAGAGCGSCRMLIQELIDTRSDITG